jgi:hypothetical protein
MWVVYSLLPKIKSWLILQPLFSPNSFDDFQILCFLHGLLTIPVYLLILCHFLKLLNNNLQIFIGVCAIFSFNPLHQFGVELHPSYVVNLQTFMLIIPLSPCCKTYFSSYCWMFVSCCYITSLCNLNSTKFFFFPFFGSLVIISSCAFIITNCFIIII